MDIKSLYGIADEVQKLLGEISSSDGEISEEMELKLKEAQDLLVKKTDNVVFWVQSQEDLINLAGQKINHLKSFIKATEERIENFNRYVADCMEKQKVTRLEGQLAYISKMAPRDIVTVFDESKLPLEFVNTPQPKSTPMLDKISEAIESGIKVPGAVIEKSKKISIKYAVKKGAKNGKRTESEKTILE